LDLLFGSACLRPFGKTPAPASAHNECRNANEADSEGVDGEVGPAAATAGDERLVKLIDLGKGERH
jgi:hypothetical protein